MSEKIKTRTIPRARVIIPIKSKIKIPIKTPAYEEKNEK